MRASHVAESVRWAYFHRRPLMIWGPPGVGKTDVVCQSADDITQMIQGIDLPKGATDEQREMVSAIQSGEKLKVIDFRLALRDPTDLKGYPMADLKAKKMVFLHDEQLPMDGYGLLFMDEMNSAMPAVQACGMQLTLTRRIGSYELPPGWVVVAAGNREGDRGVTNRMPAPLLNRFTHITMEVNNEDWITWGLTKGKISAELIAFHRWRTDKLFTFDPKSASNAFGTPRSWAATDQIIHDEMLSKEVKYHLLRGTVGEGEGGEYHTFLEIQSKLPKIEDIKRSPDKVVIPDDPSILWCLTTMLASYVTPKDFESLANFSCRLPMEFQAVFIRDVMKRDPDIKTNRSFQNWALKNSDILVGSLR